jgi:hypothetical protein
MRFDQLPESIRVKLYEDDQRQLWEKAGNMQQAAKETGYPASKVYNWKNQDSFIPADFISSYLIPEKIRSLKGGGRSNPVEGICFPLQKNDELLTRISCSVSVNREGVPVYRTRDRGNAARFVELLKNYGDVPVKVYNRDAFEVRYPKYLQQIFSDMGYSEKFAALVDEAGEVRKGKIVYRDRFVELDEFEGRLYSRSLRLELALARENSEEIARLMAEESQDVTKLVES